MWKAICGKQLRNLPIHRVFGNCPAFNEEKTIIDNVNSMLALEYPLFEVVIVNDGSTDSTLKKMIEHYELIEVPMPILSESKPNRSEDSSNLPVRNTVDSSL